MVRRPPDASRREVLCRQQPPIAEVRADMSRRLRTVAHLADARLTQFRQSQHEQQLEHAAAARTGSQLPTSYEVQQRLGLSASFESTLHLETSGFDPNRPHAPDAGMPGGRCPVCTERELTGQTGREHNVPILWDNAPCPLCGVTIETASYDISGGSESSPQLVPLLPIGPDDRAPAERPGTGEWAQRSPRALWSYVSDMSTEAGLEARAHGGLRWGDADQPLLHGLPEQYAQFCRVKMGARSRRLYFPPWAQREGVEWEDQVHSFENHRWLWASLSQATRRQILRVPQHELLSRAVSEHPASKSGAPAGYMLPPGGVELLADYLADPDFCRAVQTSFLDAILCGQALLPVHAVVHYDRRPRGECIAGEIISEAAPGSGEIRSPPSKRKSKRRTGAAYRTATGRPLRGGAPRRPLARESPTTLEELSGWAGAVSEMEQQWATIATEGIAEDDELRRPNRKHAAALLSKCLADAVPISAEDALADRRYPWRMPFLLRPPQPNAPVVPTGNGRHIRLRIRVGGSADRLLAYCLRCSRYRSSDEFFLEQLEQGQHCTAEDCSYCFRRGVRWCWYCVTEEMQSNPGNVTPAIRREAAAQEECSELIRWAWSVLDERLHATLGRPMHAAWGQPHFCAPLPAEAASAAETVLVDLAEAHLRLNEEFLFGGKTFSACLHFISAQLRRHVPYDRFSKSHTALVGCRLFAFSAMEPLPWRAPLGAATLRSAGVDREPILRQPRGARAAAAAAVRGLGPAAASDAEFQLILHTIDELLGQRETGALARTAAAQDHLAKLGRALLRRLHQQASKLPEPDLLLLTHKYLHLRRCLAADRPTRRPELTARADPDKNFDSRSNAAGPSLPGQRAREASRRTRSIRLKPPDTTALGHDEGIRQHAECGGMPSPARSNGVWSDDSDEYVRKVLTSECTSGGEDGIEFREQGEESPICEDVDRDGLLWDAPEVSSTLAWEARRLLKTFQQSGGDGLAVGPARSTLASGALHGRRREKNVASRAKQGRRRTCQASNSKQTHKAAQVYAHSDLHGYMDSNTAYNAMHPSATTLRHGTHQDVRQGLRDLRTPETGGGGGANGLVRGQPVSLKTWDRSLGRDRY